MSSPSKISVCGALLLCAACVKPSVPNDLNPFSSSGGAHSNNASQMPGPEQVVSMPVTDIPGHESLQDDSPKQGPRLMPAETLIRSYLSLFGALVPGAGTSAVTATQLQTVLRSGVGGTELFDTWTTYLSTLGVPDYMDDIPRGSQVNSLMITTFERMGVALCDRAMQHDHPSNALPAASGAVIFDFALPTSHLAPGTGGTIPAAFTTALDGMHKRFLGYPLALAPPGRAQNFFDAYRAIVLNHLPDGGGANTALSAEAAGWAGVCYGLIRHPEFHQY